MLKKTLVGILTLLMLFSNHMGAIASAETMNETNDIITEFGDINVSGITEYIVEDSKVSAIPLPRATRNALPVTDSFIPDNLDLEITPRVPIGRDDRIRVNNTTAFPNSAIGQVVTTWPNGTMTVGTAWMYGNRVAITAGHVVYDAIRGGWARSVEFHPGRNGTSSPLGIYHATRMYTDTKYLATKDSNFDWGMLRFSTNVGARTGYLGAEWTSASQVNTHVTIRGYPVEKSSQMWTAGGNITHSFATRTRYTIDTTGGQSGSPVYRGSTNRAVAIHSSGASSNGVGLYNTGQRITESLFNIMTDARRW